LIITIAQLERQHAAGYAAHPQEPAEIAEWEPEQVWKDRFGPYIAHLPRARMVAIRDAIAFALGFDTLEA
jgi:hypothetical protein